MALDQFSTDRTIRDEANPTGLSGMDTTSPGDSLQNSHLMAILSL
jgi:hypothetical protein